ncbi:MAG: WD40/YVTN/BNR-like repeat-containing protein, partial [Gemmatimonadales bacterium]
MAPSNPRRVYAVVDCLLPDTNAPAPTPAPAAAGGGRGAGGGGRGGGGGAGGGRGAAQPMLGGFFRSDDGGATWTRVSDDQALWGRGWYFEHIAVDPHDADVVYVPNVATSRTKDGGKTWDVIRGSPGGDDYHQLWVSPDDPNTVILASDQGTIISRNAREDDPTQVTWSSWLNQPTAQLYRISVDYRTPYWVIASQQDSGGVAVDSRGRFAEISTRDWEPIGAIGESGDCAGDPLHPGIVYGGSGSRFDLILNTSAPGGRAPGGRGDWTQPLTLSPADPRALYYASEILYKSTDTSKTWQAISPDLTRPDPGVPSNLDAAAAAAVDRNAKRGTIYAIAPSPLVIPMVWIGTDDGLIQLTMNDGKAWQDVTPPAITAWNRVTMLEASHFDFNSAYATVDRHQLQDFDPYIYRTRDLGKSWQKITNGLPAGVYVHCIKEDPQRQGLLFAGTERGAFVSFDDGDSWQALQLNLPITSVRDFEIYQNDLIVGTHGRGFWVLDDISPLRQVSDQLLAEDAHLFKPADAIDFVRTGDNGTPLQKDEPQAPQAPDGAAIYYYLKGAASDVKLEIVDERGEVVETFPPAPGGGGGRGFGGGGRGGGGIPNTSPLWRQTPEPFSMATGLHRVNWAPGGGGGRGGFGGFGGGGGRGGRGRGG